MIRIKTDSHNSSDLQILDEAGKNLLDVLAVEELDIEFRSCEAIHGRMKLYLKPDIKMEEVDLRIEPLDEILERLVPEVPHQMDLKKELHELWLRSRHENRQD